MVNRPESSGFRYRKGPAVIPCRYGLIYTVAPDALGALLGESESIVGQLRRIQGVTVDLVDGVMNALFPPILLAEVARVMRPLPRT